MLWLGEVESLICNFNLFFFFYVRCDDRAKFSGRWLLGSPPSAVVRQLAPRAWCPLQCLLAKTVGILSPGVCRSEECAQEFAPQSHIHSGLNQQDLVSSDVSVWQHEHLSEQTRPWGTVACWWDVRQPTNKLSRSVSRLRRSLAQSDVELCCDRPWGQEGCCLLVS